MVSQRAAGRQTERPETSARWRFYGPMAREGARLLAPFTDAEPERMRGFLLQAAQLVDRHRARLRQPAVASRAPRQ